MRIPVKVIDGGFGSRDDRDPSERPDERNRGPARDRRYRREAVNDPFSRDSERRSSRGAARDMEDIKEVSGMSDNGGERDREGPDRKSVV